MTRRYEARLMSGNVPMHLMTLTKPFPPTLRWCPSSAPKASFSLEGLNLQDLGDGVLLFLYCGVEVDMTGTWVRYERG